jgi:hypothetical protein
MMIDMPLMNLRLVGVPAKMEQLHGKMEKEQ